MWQTLGRLYTLVVAILVVVSLLFTSFANTLIIAALGLSLPLLVRGIRTHVGAVQETPQSFVHVLAFLAATVGALLWSPSEPAPTLGRTELNCEQYQLSLYFDPSHNTFSGSQKIDLVLESDNDEDLKGFKSGQPIVPASSNGLMQLLVGEGFAGWTVISVENGDRDDRGNRKATVELTSNTIDIKTSKDGLLRYVSEIDTPRAVKGRKPPKVEVILEAPQNSYLKHNLNGSFSDTVLENNEEGRRLVADRILDPQNTIRLSFPPSIFQGEIMHKLLEVTWWKLILWIFAILAFCFGIIVAVVTDVIKDYLKPVVVKVFGRLHLIKKSNGRASKAKTNDQPTYAMNKKGRKRPSGEVIPKKSIEEEISVSEKRIKRD